MKNFFPALLLFIAVTVSCSKDDSPEEPEIVNKVAISMSVSDVNTNSAKVQAQITSDVPPEELGVSWAAQNEDFTHQSLTVAPEVSTTLSNLLPNTNYSVRFYAKKNGQMFYSPTKTFTTKSAVYDGSVKLTTQAEVESFGENGYEEITGSLEITENNPGDIASLAPLKDLKKVSTLKIYSVSQLENLTGLEQMESSGSIVITDNSALTQVEALSNIDSDLMFLYFHDNTVLSSLKGLEGISFAQQVEFKFNPALKNFQGLNNLTEVHDLIVENNGLQSFEGLGLKKAEEIQITTNNFLTSLAGFEGLKEISLMLNIDNNKQLANLSGLENLELLSGLIIYHNVILENLDGLSNIKPESFGAGMISNNNKLVDLCGIANLYTTVGADAFDISNNAYNPTASDFEAGNCSNN